MRAFSFKGHLPEWGLAVALVLLIGIGVFSQRYAREQIAAASWVAHTHEVISQLEGIRTGVATAESDLRGFSLTHDLRYLDDFEPSIDLARESFRSARQLTGDQPVQQARLDVLGPRLSRRLDLLHESLPRVMKSTGPGTIPPEAQSLSEQIRAAVVELEATERQLLSARESANRSRAEAMVRASSIGVLVSAGLIILAGLLLRRETRERLRSEQARLALETARLREITLLLQMGELLHACRTLAEAHDLVASMAEEIFSTGAGAVYLFDASRTEVERKSAWGALAAQPDGGFPPEDCWALRRGRTHVVNDIKPGIVCKHVTEPMPKATLCLPLLAQSELLGMVYLASDHPIDEDMGRRAAIVGEQIGMAIANLELREALRNQSIRDPLTGLFNRRYAEQTLERETIRARRESRPLALLMLDVDHFKTFNDRFGHDAGDLVLQEVAKVMRTSVRGSDMACRLGGEEFLVVLPASIEQARMKAEQIRQSVQSLSLRHFGNALGSVTISIGVAVWPDCGDAVEELLRVADAALYAAKNGGRNRVELAPVRDRVEEAPELDAVSRTSASAIKTLPQHSKTAAHAAGADRDK